MSTPSRVCIIARVYMETKPKRREKDGSQMNVSTASAETAPPTVTSTAPSL